MIRNRYLILTILCAFAYTFGVWEISLVDPDEVFYAGTAREMWNRGDLLTPYIFGSPQFEKPPLYYWLLMAGFKVFGETPFAARLPGIFFALATVLATFWFLRKTTTERIAWLGALALGTNLWWIGISKSVLTDIVFSALIAFAYFAFYLWFKEKKNSSLYYFALWTALAVLTKGPLGLAFPLFSSVLFLIFMKERPRLFKFLFHPWWLLFILVAIPWYAVTFANFGKEFWEEFFVRDHWLRLLSAEHKNFDRWYFYPGLMILSMMPWAVFFPVFGRGWKEKRELSWFLFFWIVVVFAICEVAHSKLASYISPLYPALSILFAVSLDKALENRARWQEIVTSVLCAVFALACVIVPFLIRHKVSELFWQICICLIPLALYFAYTAFIVHRGKFNQAFAATALILPLAMILPAYLVVPHLEVGLTDSDMKQRVEEANYGAGTVVASKIYSRGVFYYSGNPVVVVANNKHPFWSPHPITVLSEDSEIREFYSAKNRVLSVLSKKDYERVAKILGDGFKHSQLSEKLGRVVVLTERESAKSIDGT